MAVYGYIRVSTSEQATGGDSLDTQATKIGGYAMMQGWTVDRNFTEVASGSIPLADRQEGAALLSKVKRGDVIVTTKLDRMFRNASDALTTLEELKEVGVGLVMLDLGGDVTTNGISKLVFTILSAVAENERDRIRERIREVKRHLASKGVYGGGKVPYGFDLVEGHLVENGEQQAVIRAMVKMRGEGMSFHKIAGAVGMQAMSVKRIIDRQSA